MPSGTIIKALAGFYYVRDGENTVECRARGKFRRDGESPLVGDKVEYSVDSEGGGRVDKILPRRNMFIRPAVANIDVMIAVASETNPVTDPYLIDRVTTTAENKGCRVVICVNKSDLCPSTRLRGIYSKTPYEVIETSAVTREGIESLRESIRGCVCAFSGNSGVGKSSILNALAPGLCLATGEVSDKLGRGRHTTRHVELFDIGGAYVADTPGFASFDFEQLSPIPKEDLQHCFPEFGEYLGSCRFLDCAHLKEPDCAVTRAVTEGRISRSRYESYKLLYDISAQYKEWENK